MNTQPTRIRPRMRAAEPSPRNVLPPAEQDEKHTHSDEGLSGVPVLARLPEVSALSDRARLSLQLDWFKKLDWKRVRRVNLDPNWVAGGVLALVLFLLLVITLNRGPKPAADAAAEGEAPSWNGAGKVTAPTTLSATPNVAAANPSSVLPNSAINSAPASAMVGADVNQAGALHGPSRTVEPVGPSYSASAAGPQGQFSLEGVFYPRTPHAPVGIAAHASVDHSLNQQIGSSYGRELRTAQREVPAGHHPHLQPGTPQLGAPQTGRAQFEGTISQP